MNGDHDTFEPRADDDGLVRAGSLPLFRIGDDGLLYWIDRHGARCRARGTDVVGVDPVDLFLEIRGYIGRRLAEF